MVAIMVWLFIAFRERNASAPAASAVRDPLPFGIGLAWLIGLFFACDNFLFYGCLSWMVTLYRELGLDETKAGLILATYTGTFIFATPIAGALSRNIDRRIALALWSTVMLAGLLVLAAAPLLAPHITVILIAFGIAGGFTLGMTLPLDNTDGPGEATAWTACALTTAIPSPQPGPSS